MDVVSPKDELWNAPRCPPELTCCCILPVRSKALALPCAVSVTLGDMSKRHSMQEIDDLSGKADQKTNSVMIDFDDKYMCYDPALL